ncbi:MAG: agmatinase family protein [Cyclobacteriaceae bacterium]
MKFDPGEVGQKGKLFGFPYSEEESDLILIPVPWDVTVSYSDGTAHGPQRILDESSQLDFALPHLRGGHLYPVTMLPINEAWQRRSTENRTLAKDVIDKLEGEGEFGMEDLVNIANVTRAGHKLNQELFETASNYLDQDKVVGTVGGDHSTPLGLIQALGEKHEDFGILQIDAHMDLREAYEGFEYSHASIMTNAINVSSVSKLVQVGIRDFCEEEKDAAEGSSGKVSVHFDEVMRKEMRSGTSWEVIVNRILDKLPQKVYISFDIDGLEPSLCPHTGTPVPGGLSFYEAASLIEAVARSGREIIGFDLSETGDHPWDANVASRILYRLSTATGVSRGHLTYSKA